MKRRWTTFPKAASVWLAFVLAISVGYADEFTQSFANWPPGSGSYDGWTVGNGAIVMETSYTNFTPRSLQFPTTSSNGFLQFPPITNGIGTVSFYARQSRLFLGTNLIQRSETGTNWTTVAVIPFSNSASFVLFSTNLHLYGSQYLRIAALGAPRYAFYIDDVSMSHPPARIAIASVNVRTTQGSPDIYVNDEVLISATITPYGMPSNIQLTTYYRVGEAGSWNPISMISTSSPNSYVTQSPIPGQGIGKVYYYVQATFNGPPPHGADSPTNYPAAGPSAPAFYEVAIRPYQAQNSTMNLIGDLSAVMTLANDYQWEAFVSYTGTSFSIQFQGVSNSTNRTWGDNNQSTSLPPFTLVAEENGTAIHIQPPTNTGQLLFRFIETNRAYTIKHVVASDFDSWVAPVPGTYTNDGWILHNGLVSSLSDVKLRNNFVALESNTVSWLRSPFLPYGIGEIAFWYRNYNTNGAPQTEVHVEKSKTGGTNASEWAPIQVVSNVYAPGYNRLIVVPADREYSYIRILNSPHYPNARLCLDEILIAQPGAGLLFTNAVHTPSLPAASNPVTVSVTILPLGGASNRQATLWYRTGSTGEWNSIAMNRSNDLFTTATPIPPGKGDKPGGAGVVQYFFECSFEGYESAHSSPFFYPMIFESPLAYTVQPAQVTVTNAITSPDPPVTGAVTHLRVDILPHNGASNISATAWYRLNRSGSYTAIPMAWLTNNTWQTTSNIPAQTISGLALEYYFTVSFSGPDPVSPTNYPVNATNTVFGTLFRSIPWTSTYSSVTVTGALIRSMRLNANGNWRATLGVTNAASPTFRFAASGGGNPVWYDGNQSVTNLPVYGTAETVGSDILISGLHSGYFVFSFNDSNLNYNVQRAQIVTGEGWPTSYGWSANADGWFLAGRRSQTSDTNDAARILDGDFLVLQGGSSTNNLLRSPEMTNGIGEISFYYRNWYDDGSRPVSFAVETAPTPTGTWTAVATVTNVRAVDYQFFYTFLSDRVQRYVRIRNTSAAINDRLCLDEIVVSDAGAGVAFTNHSLSPSSPTIMESVTVSIEIHPLTGATDFQPTLWYKAGTTDISYYEYVPMTNVSGNLYRAVIPPGPIGNMYYFIRCAYSGFGASYSSPAYHPYGGSANPLVYSNADGGTFEGFESWPYSTDNKGIYSGPGYNDWSVYNAQCRGDGQFWAAPGSTNRAIWFTQGTRFNSEDSVLITPLITNLYGMVHLTFWVRNYDAKINELSVHTTYAPTPSTNWNNTNEWTFVTNFTVPSSTNWTMRRVDFTNNLFRIMLRKSSGESYMGLDRVAIAQRSAAVAFSNLLIRPGYPASNDAVWITCDIDTFQPGMPAYNIQPKLYYKLPGQPNFQGPLTMTKDPAVRRFTTATNIPPSTFNQDVQFYIRADFDGYSHIPELARSPMYYPTNNPTASPFTYRPGLKKTDYGTLYAAADVGGTNMALVDDYVWQGVVRLASPASTIQFYFNGYSNYTGSGYSSSITNWGRNDNVWKTNPPLHDYALHNGLDPILTVGSPLQGQIFVRFNERTGEYSIRRADSQLFENWSVSSTFMYSGNSDSEIFGESFDSWPTNGVRDALENFEASGTWTNAAGQKPFSVYTNKLYGGTKGWGIYDALITNNVGSGANAAGFVARLSDIPRSYGRGWVINAQQGNYPLEGIGTISFSYRAFHTNVWNPVTEQWEPSNPPPATLRVHLGPTNYPAYETPTLWQTLLAITGIVDNTWRSTNILVQTSAFHSVIFEHSAGDTCVLLDSLNFTDFNATYFSSNGWTAAEAWISTNTGRNPNNPSITNAGIALEFNTRRFNEPAYLRSPLMTNGVGFFDLYYRSADGQTVSFEVYFSRLSGTNLVDELLDTVTANPSLFTAYGLAPMTNAVGYMKVIPKQGRLVLDDVRVTGLPTEGSWQANNARVSEESSVQFRDRVMILNNGTSGADPNRTDFSQWPYLKSPYLPRGFGELSFWYRNTHTGGSPSGYLRLQKSATGGASEDEWTTIYHLTNIVNTAYRYLRLYHFDPNARYVRIVNVTNQTARIALDEIIVTEPVASDFILTNLHISPEAPVFTNKVHVYIDLKDPFMNPVNISLYCDYSLATNYGGWTTTNTLGMDIVAANASNRTWTWRTIEPIPRQPSDTFVSYQVRAVFEGEDGLIANSPKTNRDFATPWFYYPLDYGTNIPYYIVLSCPTNAVWINEVDPGNTLFFYPHLYDFVELCGRRSMDIANWKIVFFNNADPPQQMFSYTIPPGTTLPDQTNGFGFFVLGKTTLPITPDLVLTNDIPYPGGIALQRPAGMYSHAVCFADNESEVASLKARRFAYIGNDGGEWFGFDSYSIRAIGNGSFGSDFTWLFEEVSATPGAINLDQTLIPTSDIVENRPPSEVRIVDLWFESQRLWMTVTGTNNWLPAPWMTTNLLMPGSWTPVQNFEVYELDTNTWTYTLQFLPPTNYYLYLFKVVTTNASQY